VGPYLSASAIQSVKKQWPQLAETTGALLRLDPFDYPQAYYMNALANYNLGNIDAAEKSARVPHPLQPLEEPHKEVLRAAPGQCRVPFSGVKGPAGGADPIGAQPSLNLSRQLEV